MADTPAEIQKRASDYANSQRPLTRAEQERQHAAAWASRFPTSLVKRVRDRQAEDIQAGRNIDNEQERYAFDRFIGSDAGKGSRDLMKMNATAQDRAAGRAQGDQRIAIEQARLDAQKEQQAAARTLADKKFALDEQVKANALKIQSAHIELATKQDAQTTALTLAHAQAINDGLREGTKEFADRMLLPYASNPLAAKATQEKVKTGLKLHQSVESMLHQLTPQQAARARVTSRDDGTNSISFGPEPGPTKEKQLQGLQKAYDYATDHRAKMEVTDPADTTKTKTVPQTGYTREDWQRADAVKQTLRDQMNALTSQGVSPDTKDVPSMALPVSQNMSESDISGDAPVLSGERIRVVHANGQTGDIPVEHLDSALAAGYKQEPTDAGN